MSWFSFCVSSFWFSEILVWAKLFHQSLRNAAGSCKNKQTERNSTLSVSSCLKVTFSLSDSEVLQLPRPNTYLYCTSKYTRNIFYSLTFHLQLLPNNVHHNARPQIKNYIQQLQFFLITIILTYKCTYQKSSYCCFNLHWTISLQYSLISFWTRVTEAAHFGIWEHFVPQTGLRFSAKATVIHLNHVLNSASF